MIRRTLRIYDEDILIGIDEVIDHHNQRDLNSYLNMLIKRDVKKLRRLGEVTSPNN